MRKNEGGGGDSNGSRAQGVVTRRLGLPGGGDTSAADGPRLRCFRDPDRIKRCVAAYTVTAPEITTLVDDDGKMRTVSWGAVHEAAIATQKTLARGLHYPCMIEPPRLHQVAWLSLAVFSPQWLEESAEAMNEGLRSGVKPTNGTKYFLGCARNLLKRFENLPENGQGLAARFHGGSLRGDQALDSPPARGGQGSAIQGPGHGPRRRPPRTGSVSGRRQSK